MPVTVIPPRRNDDPGPKLTGLPKIGHYPSHFVLSQDETRQMIEQMRGGARKKHLDQLEEKRQAEVKKRKEEREKKQAESAVAAAAKDAEKKARQQEDELESDSDREKEERVPNLGDITREKFKLIAEDGLEYNQVVLPGQVPKDEGTSKSKDKRKTTCGCGLEHGKFKKPGVVQHVAHPVDPEFASNKELHEFASSGTTLTHVIAQALICESYGVEPYEDAWITAKGFKRHLDLINETDFRKPRSKRRGGYHDPNMPRDVKKCIIEVLGNEICSYETTARRTPHKMNKLYAHVEALGYYLKTPEYDSWTIDDDKKKVEDLCLLIAYLFADFFLRIEKSEKHIARYKKNIGLIFGCYLSTFDSWSEERCELLALKSAKLVRRVEKFAVDNGIQLKELEAGEILDWPKYDEDYAEELSRLLEPGMLPKFMEVFRRKHGRLGGIEYYQEPEELEDMGYDPDDDLYYDGYDDEEDGDSFDEELEDAIYGPHVTVATGAAGPIYGGGYYDMY